MVFTHFLPYPCALTLLFQSRVYGRELRCSVRNKGGPKLSDISLVPACSHSHAAVALLSHMAMVPFHLVRRQGHASFLLRTASAQTVEFWGVLPSLNTEQIKQSIQPVSKMQHIPAISPGGHSATHARAANQVEVGKEGELTSAQDVHSLLLLTAF